MDTDQKYQPLLPTIWIETINKRPISKDRKSNGAPASN